MNHQETLRYAQGVVKDYIPASVERKGFRFYRNPFLFIIVGFLL